MSSTGHQDTPGKVITFYSYKGGVGRSMAMVNVGVLLALAQKKVLLVDWDLEAPGLEMYFRKAASIDGDPGRVPGIIDLLENRTKGKILDWRSAILKATFLGRNIDIISAGSRTQDYRKRVQALDWDSLYDDHHIGNFVESLRNEWRSNYEFVLVDSRTGMTDIGDICTVLLPDILVLMFVSNDQNLAGIKNVVEHAIAARSKLPLNRSKLISLPLPARDEVYNEYAKSLEWKQIYAEELGHLYREWLPREVAVIDALNKLFIPYVTIWSFGEHIPVLESSREVQDPTTLGAAYKRISNLIASGLDWYRLEEKASIEELQGTYIELQQARAREAKAILARKRSLTIASVSLLATAAFAIYLFWKIAIETSYQLPIVPPPPPPEYADEHMPAGWWTDEKIIEEGRLLYLGVEIPDVNCASCHGKDGNPVKGGARDFRNTERMQLYSDSVWFWRISEGVPQTKMKSWKTKLTVEERWKLVAYERTFGLAGKKWDPSKKAWISVQERM